MKPLTGGGVLYIRHLRVLILGVFLVHISNHCGLRTDSFGLASKAASWLGVVGLLNFAGIGEIIKGLNDHSGN